MGTKITMTRETLLKIAYDVGVRHGIDTSQGRPDKFIGDPAMMMQKEIGGGKAEYVAAAVFKADYTPYSYGLNNKSRDLKLPNEICEKYGLPPESEAEVKNRPNRMLYFPDNFPHEKAALIIILSDGDAWASPEIEILGTITRTRAMELYETNKLYHTIDFGRGKGPQPVWREGDFTPLELTVYEINCLRMVGLTVQ